MTDFFSSKINYQKISHSYLFECDGSIKSNELIDNLVKQVLCTNKDKNFQCCQKCKSCHSIKGLSNPDYVEVFPDDKEKIGIGSLRGDQDKNRGIINILSETALLSEAKIVKINNADQASIISSSPCSKRFFAQKFISCGLCYRKAATG